MALRVVMVGVGGWGKTWCKNTLPCAVKDGLVEVVGVVDYNSDNFIIAKENLSIPVEHYFNHLEDAIDKTKPDACVISVRPENRQKLCLTALNSSCHLLCEKPIAGNMEDSISILNTAKKTNSKVGITMSHRHSQKISTYIKEVNSNKYGKLDYIVYNFNWNRRDGVTDRQSKTDYTMFIEGSIHQVDIIRSLVSSECDWVFAESWNPSWGNFTKGSQAIITMKFLNDTRISYETAWANATAQNGWGNDLIRAEFENATVILRGEDVVLIDQASNETKIPLITGGHWGNDLLLRQFVNWVNGSNPMKTKIEDNIFSQGLVFAAIESAKTGRKIDVQSFYKQWGIV